MTAAEFLAQSGSQGSRMPFAVHFVLLEELKQLIHFSYFAPLF
jgi:hypothetical protein